MARWAWDVHFNKPISAEAALVHGCKDGSLLEALIEAQTPVATEEEKEPYWTDGKEPTEPTREAKAAKAAEARSKLLKAREAVTK